MTFPVHSSWRCRFLPLVVALIVASTCFYGLTVFKYDVRTPARLAEDEHSVDGGSDAQAAAQHHEKSDILARRCCRVYFDLGGNIGVTVRKFFEEPEAYPDQDATQPWLRAPTGASSSSSSTSSDVCGCLQPLQIAVCRRDFEI